MKNHNHKYFNKLVSAINKLETTKIDLLKKKIKSLIGSKRTMYICGNGGSAATASHMVADLTKTILGGNPRIKKRRLKAVSLNDAIPSMTAWGNDEGYDYIFSEQLKTLGVKKDFLLVITGSGNSNNIIEVLKEARKKRIETFALLGFDGGKAKSLANNFLLVPSNDYGVIEDVHMIINHLLTDYFKNSNL